MSDKDLRRDPIAEKLEKFIERVLHPTPTEKKIGIGVIVAIIIGIIYWYSTRPVYNTDAQMTLFRVITTMAYLTPQDTANGRAIETALNNLIKQYRGTESAKRAFYYLGVYYITMKKYSKAEEAFKTFLNQGVKDPLLISASYGYLGTISIEKGDLKKAYEYLIKAAEKSPLKSLKAFYLYRAGKLMEHEGKLDQALALYEKIKKVYPQFKLGAGYMPGANIDINFEINRLKTLMEVKKE